MFFDNWDMALLKVNHFNESKVLDVRMETFNTFTTHSFSARHQSLPTSAIRHSDKL